MIRLCRMNSAQALGVFIPFISHYCKALVLAQVKYFRDFFFMYALCMPTLTYLQSIPSFLFDAIFEYCLHYVYAGLFLSLTSFLCVILMLCCKYVQVILQGSNMSTMWGQIIHFLCVFVFFKKPTGIGCFVKRKPSFNEEQRKNFKHCLD